MKVSSDLCFVDSHVHLASKAFSRDREAVLQRALEEGVCALLSPAEVSDASELPRLLEVRKVYPNVFISAGVHPHQAKNFRPSEAETIETLAREGIICAVGEIGLDFHYNLSPPSVQIEVFRTQLRMAQKMGLPVIVHCRKASREVAAAVEEEGFTNRGVLHCFSESLDFAKRMIAHGFLVSFSGILTYGSAGNLRHVARQLPIENILIETDAPYLVPEPRKGRTKRNEPAFLKDIARTLAEIRNTSVEDVARATTGNYQTLFRLKFKKRDVKIGPPTDGDT
ncbi:MAG: TatD family hydrolase [Candidatus Aminicenantales bacterium]